MKVIPLTEADVHFDVSCLPEFVAPEGNASAIGPVADKKIVSRIYRQLNCGNEWAWCIIRVVARWGQFEGEDQLGCCSYESKHDFMQKGGYFDDMKAVALQRLNEAVAEAADLIGGRLQT